MLKCIHHLQRPSVRSDISSAEVSVPTHRPAGIPNVAEEIPVDAIRPAVVIKNADVTIALTMRYLTACFLVFFERQRMLEDVAEIRKAVLACGTVDLRKGIYGLARIIGDKYKQNPFEKGTLFLFCDQRSDRIKGLL